VVPYGAGVRRTLQSRVRHADGRRHRDAEREGDEDNDLAKIGFDATVVPFLLSGLGAHYKRGRDGERREL